MSSLFALNEGPNRLWGVTLQSSAGKPLVVFPPLHPHTLHITAATLIPSSNRPSQEINDEDLMEEEEEEQMEEVPKKGSATNKKNSSKKSCATKKDDDSESDEEIKSAKPEGEVVETINLDDEDDEQIQEDPNTLYYITATNVSQSNRIVLAALHPLNNPHVALNYQISSYENTKHSELHFDLFSFPASDAFNVQLTGFIKKDFIAAEAVTSTPSTTITEETTNSNTNNQNNTTTTNNNNNNNNKNNKKRKQSEDSTDVSPAASTEQSAKKSKDSKDGKAAKEKTAATPTTPAKKNTSEEENKTNNASAKKKENESKKSGEGKEDENVVILPNGLRYKDKEMGTGKQVKAGDRVSIRYKGQFLDGRIFDTNMPRKPPLRWTLGDGSMIKGFDSGTTGMRVGGKRMCVVPPHLGYGKQGAPPDIPGNSTLIFTIELLDAK